MIRFNRPFTRASSAGLVALAALFLALAWYSSTRPIDFQLYHRVAEQVLRGDYELYTRAVYDGADHRDSHEFQYAPVVGLLFVPLAWLPLQAAAFAFACLKILAYGYMGWVVARRLRVEARYTTLIVTALFVVGGYLVEEFRNGNFHAFTALLMVVAFDQSERGRTVVPAGALALAIVAKLTPLALLAYFAVRRRFALCAATVAAIGLLLALPAAVVGVDANAHLVEGFVRSAAGMIDESDNYSLRGALLRLADLPLGLVTGVWVAVLVGLALALAVTMWKEPKDSTTRLVEFSVVLTAMLVVSPHTQRIHFSMLFVPAVTMIGLLVQSPQLHRAGLVRAALAVNAAAATLLPLIFGGRRASLAYQAFSPYTLAAIVVLVALMALVVELKTSAGRSSPISQA